MRKWLFIAFGTLMALSVSVHAEPPTLRLASASAVLPVRRTSTELLHALGAGHPWMIAGEERPRALPAPLGLDLDTTGLALASVPWGGMSTGRPHRGRLRDGVQMPRDPARYLVRRPEVAYGSSHTITHLQLALAKFRQYSRYRGPIVISDISRPRGGRNRPHRSHQSGRDVDLWLPLQCDEGGVTVRGGAMGTSTEVDFARFSAARAREVDWDASWELVKALLRTGQVEEIFLSRSRQRLLHQAGRRDGMTPEQLGALIQYPDHTRTALIRHVPGHDRHMHVRFRCAASETRCR